MDSCYTCSGGRCFRRGLVVVAPLQVLSPKGLVVPLLLLFIAMLLLLLLHMAGTCATLLLLLHCYSSLAVAAAAGRQTDSYYCCYCSPSAFAEAAARPEQRQTGRADRRRRAEVAEAAVRAQLQ